MTKIIQIAQNAVIGKLLTDDKEVKQIIHQLLSFVVEGKEFANAFVSGTWNGRSSLFSTVKRTFPAGFVPSIQQALSKRGYEVKIVRKALPLPLGPENPIVDSHGNDDPRYDFQMETVRRLLKHGRLIAQVATGGGKCLGVDTPIMMFDGTVKMVQDVIVGDQLMGPDSCPRNVLTTTSGRSALYKVIPKKGDSYIVNDAHILSLKKTSRGYRGKNRDGEKYSKGEIVNINVEQFISEKKTFRHIHKGWRTGVDFVAGAELLVDPYFVGALLGDGSINGMISMTTADVETVVEVEHQAKVWGLGIKSYQQTDNKASTYFMTGGMTGGSVNPLMAALRFYGLGKEKFVPHSYKTASRKERFELLAGVLDTDGYYDGKCFYLTQKNERLLDDIIFVARSLGFAAYKKSVQKTCCNNGKVGTYYSIAISGDLETIPVRLKRRRANPRMQKKDHLVVGLNIERVEDGQYFGFEIDGDSLFLLGDFTVTHNTKIAMLCTARIKRPTTFFTTRSVLMYQMRDAFLAAGIPCGVMGDGDWSPLIGGVNVAMIQTLRARVQTMTFEEEVIRDADRCAGAEEKDLLKLKTSLLASKTPKADILRALSKRRQELTRARPTATRGATEILKRVEAQNALMAETVKILETMEFVIGEEAHEAGGNSYNDVLKYCINANYRLALTATPFMRQDAEDNMRLMGAFGQIGIKVSEKTLIDRGILATPYFKYLVVPAPDRVFKSTGYERAIKYGIIENHVRNVSIVREAMKAARRKMPVMILVSRKDHGRTLVAMFKKMNIKVSFMKGENDNAERRRELDKLGRGEIEVLIGTNILDVGVDVPAVGMIILAGGGKAEIALRQRIGRGLRAKKVGPNLCFVVDFVDPGNVHLSGHAKQRRAIVEATEGFGENILAANDDFKWSVIDNWRAA